MRRRSTYYASIAILALYFMSPVSATAQVTSQSEVDYSQLSETPKFSMPADVGTISVEAGFAYSTHVEDLGISVGGWYQILEAIAAGVTFTYYFVGDEGDVSFTIWTLDFNGRYAILTTDSGMTVFLVGGLNYLKWSADYDNQFCGSFGINCGSSSASDVGLNAGGMVIIPLGGFNVFAKAFVVGLGGDSSGLAIGGGATFDL